MEIPENELIRRLKRFEKKSQKIIRGIGDDGAVVGMSRGEYVFVQDTVVEHVHFEFAFMDARAVGKKALYVNISDIFSMGAIPLYFLVTIGIPGSMSYDDIRQLYAGMMQVAREFNVSLIGGDTSATKSDFFIDISAVGKLVTDHYLGRDGTKEGDLIGVTGFLGESAYGLYLLKKGIRRKKSRFIERYVNPKPPYGVWKELIDRRIPSGMMDISDGLIIDLERMMKESRKGAHVYFERLPVPRELVRKGKEHFALSGGEDYQFLFSFHPAKLAAIEELQQKGLPVSVIGRVIKGRGVKLFRDGNFMPVMSKGYEHFGD
ncbi:MAG: thiamine-phosphate kinase [Syntrophobacterales bacterium]|jgi:thiamine-monophosphate kinase|nr:thiamine-phosphate kinase [Syntrophobacterales bacterium]